MDLETVKKFGWSSASDFRAKATFGVAIAALTLLLPISMLDFYLGEMAIGIGSLGIVFILGANAWTVLNGRCHQNLTLFGLIPAGMIFMIGVFHNDGFIGTLWCFPSIVAGYCMLSQRRAWIANATVLIIALPMTWLTLNTEYAIRITATLVAVSLFGESWSSWTKHADDRLYIAKHSGRNCVVAKDSAKPELSPLKSVPLLVR